jgi:hypothetical protein
VDSLFPGSDKPGVSPPATSRRSTSGGPPQPPPAPIRSSSEGNAVPTTDEEQDFSTRVVAKGAPLCSEGDTEEHSDPVVKPESPPSSKYWDEDLLEKRRRKPNPKYTQHAERFIHHANKSLKVRDYDRGQFMNLDWKSNLLQQVPTYYWKMMALLQLATDPFTNEIDGDLHPCSLSSKEKRIIRLTTKQ